MTNIIVSRSFRSSVGDKSRLLTQTLLVDDEEASCVWRKCYQSLGASVNEANTDLQFEWLSTNFFSRILFQTQSPIATQRWESAWRDMTAAKRVLRDEQAFLATDELPKPNKYGDECARHGQAFYPIVLSAFGKAQFVSSICWLFWQTKPTRFIAFGIEGAEENEERGGRGRNLFFLNPEETRFKKRCIDLCPFSSLRIDWYAWSFSSPFRPTLCFPELPLFPQKDLVIRISTSVITQPFRTASLFEHRSQNILKHPVFSVIIFDRSNAFFFFLVHLHQTCTLFSIIKSLFNTCFASLK